MTDLYRLAEKNIRITSVYPAVHDMCRDYRADGAADFEVVTTGADIAFEREKSAREERAEGLPIRQYEEPYLETLAVYRQIAEKMPDYDTVLFHGSCIAVDGAAYLFAAKSGTGKSTHTRLWREYLGERAFMVNDDKPLIRVQDGRALVFGTPWDGKHHLSRNTAVPLRALCILQRAARNSIEPVSAAQSLPMLLQQVYRPADGEALKKTLALVESLATSVSLWRLGCNMEVEAAQIAYNAMKG